MDKLDQEIQSLIKRGTNVNLTEGSNIEINTKNNKVYKNVPKELYIDCIKETAQKIAAYFKFQIVFQDESREFAFIGLNPDGLLNQQKLEEIQEKVLTLFDKTFKEILYRKLDTMGGYKLFNRNNSDYSDRLQNNILTITY